MSPCDMKQNNRIPKSDRKTCSIKINTQKKLLKNMMQHNLENTQNNTIC